MERQVGMKKQTVGIVAAVMVMAGVMGHAVEPKGWSFEVTPYAWLAGVEGDATVQGHKAEFDKSFSDLLDYVEFGGSLLGVVQYDRFLLWGQVDYFQMSTDALDADAQPKGGKLDSKMLLAEVAVGYQIDGWMEGQTFDLLAGVRELHLENDLEVYNKGSFSKNADLVDPVLVVRPSIPVFPSLRACKGIT